MTRTKETQRIKKLTELWYSCLVDHHKDRDCHFEIEERWSYGDFPTYQVHHYGYVADEWHSPAFTMSEAAYKWLAGKLEQMIRKEAKGWLDRIDRDDEGSEHKEHFEGILGRLKAPSPGGQEEE